MNTVLKCFKVSTIILDIKEREYSDRFYRSHENAVRSIELEWPNKPKDNRAYPDIYHIKSTCGYTIAIVSIEAVEITIYAEARKLSRELN